MKNPDEDFAYEMNRQRRIDAEWIANTKEINQGPRIDLDHYAGTYGGHTKPARRKVRVFPKFAQHVGPQRYVHQDPWPNVPFEDDVKRYIKIDRRDKWVGWACVFAALVVLGVTAWEQWVK